MKRERKDKRGAETNQKRKRLQLKRETVRELSSDQLADVAGGAHLSTQCALDGG